MKKKILAAIVCAAVMLTTACGKSEGTSQPTNSSSDQSSSAVSDSTPEESSNNESSAPESSTPEANGKFVHGKMDGNIYSSEFLGLKAEFADGWTLMTEDVLAQYNGINDMSDENVNKSLDTNAIAYEMMAAKDEVTNVNIVIENLNLTYGGKTISAEGYIDAVLGTFEAQFTATGAKDVEVKKSTVGFLGSETVCIKTTLTFEGVPKAQCIIPLSKGAYIANITFTGNNEDEVLDIVNSFKAL